MAPWLTGSDHPRCAQKKADAAAQGVGCSCLGACGACILATATAVAGLIYYMRNLHYESYELMHRANDYPSKTRSSSAILAEVEELLRRGMNVDGKDDPRMAKEGGTPLYRAAAVGNNDVVACLLAAGANVHLRMDGKDEETYHIVGQESERTETSRTPAPLSRTPLFAAADNGYCVVVQQLLEAGASPDLPGWTPLYTPPKHRSYMTPLCAAAINPRVYHPDIESHTTNRFSKQHGVAVVELLLAHGADPNAAATDGPAAGIRPLNYAAKQGNLKTVEALVNAGADVNAGWDRASLTAPGRSSSGTLGPTEPGTPGLS